MNRQTDDSHLEVIRRAAANHELLTIVYVARDGTTSTREVEPYELRAGSTGDLVVAYDRSRQDYRSFRLAGLRSVKRTGIRCDPRRPITIAA